MKVFRDVVITLAIIGGLIGVLLAMPFIVVLIVMSVLGYIIYALIHDARLDAEEEESTLNDKDHNTRNSSE